MIVLDKYQFMILVLRDYLQVFWITVLNVRSKLNDTRRPILMAIKQQCKSDGNINTNQYNEREYWWVGFHRGLWVDAKLRTIETMVLTYCLRVTQLAQTPESSRAVELPRSRSYFRWPDTKSLLEQLWRYSARLGRVNRFLIPCGEKLPNGKAGKWILILEKRSQQRQNLCVVTCEVGRAWWKKRVARRWRDNMKCGRSGMHGERER